MFDETETEIPCPICLKVSCLDHSEEQQFAVLDARVNQRPEPVFVTEPAPARKAAKREQARINREVSDLQWLMSHEPGRRFMHRLLADCGVAVNSYERAKAANAPDMALHMAFLEGSRNIGNIQLDRIQQHCLDAYWTMTKENAP